MPGDIQYEVAVDQRGGMRKNKPFTVRCWIGEKAFYDTGRLVEEAKTAAAIKVLQEIFKKENACGACGERGHTSPICPRQEIAEMVRKRGKHDETEKSERDASAVKEEAERPDRGTDRVEDRANSEIPEEKDGERKRSNR